MNGLLLTPEEQFKALADCPFEDLRGQKARDVLCQAQLNKVLSQPKLDKPNSEGWWWFIPNKDEMPELKGFYFIKDIKEALFWINGGTLACQFQGTWQRAIVPE